MSNAAMNISKMVDMLPESDRYFVQEFVKKLILAWDSDFTKVTPEEAEQIKYAENDEFISDSKINLDNLEQYAIPCFSGAPVRFVF